MDKRNTNNEQNRLFSGLSKYFLGEKCNYLAALRFLATKARKHKSRTKLLWAFVL